MRKIFFFGTGVLLTCLAVWGINQVTRPHRNAAAEQAVANLPALTLYDEFVNTESVANKTWVGKVITINGVISSISETGNYISINIRATDDGGINCSINKKDIRPDRKFHAGDLVSIKGKCTGFLMDVNLVDCVIQ